MAVFIVDYAHGFNGNTCEPDIVSRLRTNAALQAFRDFPDAYIVLGAGMSERTLECGALADMIEHLLLEKGIRADRILRNPIADNTLAETEAAYELIIKKEPDSPHIVCATSRFHLTRVRVIWKIRFGIRPTLYASDLPTRRSEYIRELWKIPRDILRSLIHLAVY